MGYNLNTRFAKEFSRPFENEYLNGLEHPRETHDSWVFFQLRLGFQDSNPSKFESQHPKITKVL